jgi:rhomboid protease GluP
MRATWGLLAANIAMFGLEMLWGGSQSGDTLEALGSLVHDQGPLDEPWRMLSSAFLHIGPLHLVANMWALFVFGTALERLLGPWRLLVLYLVSALGGGLTSTVVHLGEPQIGAGASGAVWGLMVGELALLVRLRRRLGPEAVPLDFQVLQPLLVNLAISFAPRIDMAAHLGGGAAGGLFLLVLPLRHVNGSMLWRAAAFLSVALMAASLVLALVHGRPWALG